ncbi:MAG: uracil phosphoribosyltransferase [bacterium]|nr:uracil phosphoribosyltransferase [bacterium]
MAEVKVIDHPLVQHKLSVMRCNDTAPHKFRRLMKEVSLLLAYEVTRDLPLRQVTIRTPIQEMQAPMLESPQINLVSILRAGNGLLDGILELFPSARVGHIGLYREPQSQVIIEYYLKLPQQAHEQETIVVDPMLATGHTAVAALTRLKECQYQKVKFVCLLAAPEGVAYVQEHHPDVPIFTAAIDQGLNDKSYIVPGLGDAGDRLFGTL